MNNTYVKRIASILMSLVLCVAFTVAATVQVDAASKTKTYQVVAQATNVYKPDGNKSGKEIVDYSYNKSGLRITEKSDRSDLDGVVTTTTFKKE